MVRQLLLTKFPFTVFISLLMLLFSNNSKANNATVFPFPAEHAAIVCPVTQLDLQADTFDNPKCQSLTLRQVNPQNNAIWIKIDFNKPTEWHTLSPPYGLLLMGKAASAVYLNGELLGKNGVPASDKSEQAGLMDVMMYLPSKLIKQQNNQLVLLLSAQHSLIDLSYPIHMLALTQYESPQRHLQQFALPGLVILGVFLLAAIYLVTLCTTQRSSTGSTNNNYLILAAISALAAVQLFAEISRGLIPYPYYWQDIRLLAVTIASLAVGCLLLIYTANRLQASKRLHWIYTGVFTSVATVYLVPGFDTKTTAGVFIPALFCLALLIIQYAKSRSNSLTHWLLAQSGFVICVLLNTALFHEFVYFALIAAMLVFLFVQQARDFQKQQLQQTEDTQTIAKLEYQLSNQAPNNTDKKIKASQAGSECFLNTSEIAFCKAAGDYCEIGLQDGDNYLFSGSLKQLESELGKSFLKVHRSYLVNLNQVRQIRNDNSAGVLLLNCGAEVPISRRLLPSVKSTIKEGLL